MGQITQNITGISDYPKIGDTHDVFRQKADIAWNDLANMAGELNNYKDQANSLRDDVNSWYLSVEKWTNDTLNYRNQAYAYKIEAVNAANSIKSYVIPDEATYGKDEIDVMLNGLLTQIVAQQAQISILRS